MGAHTSFYGIYKKFDKYEFGQSVEHELKFS